MSLKRRNFIALILILFASVCWTFGQQILDSYSNNQANGNTAVTTPAIAESTGATTTYTMVNPTTHPTTVTNVNETIETGESVSSELHGDVEEADYPGRKTLGIVLSLVAVVTAGITVFILLQKNPICGPDGICFILALLATAYHITLDIGNSPWNVTLEISRILSRIIKSVVFLVSIRELVGWIRFKLPLSWCLTYRVANRCATPQQSLVVYVGWVILSFIGMTYFFIADTRYPVIFYCVIGYLVAAVFGLCCLWKYGCDLNHFKTQLNNYRNGKPITVGDGAFSQTEAQLLDVQAQHEEAVRTAVTSERFKVELISNVSHDLRTPLTSILGYSELLQNETLSPAGVEQLRRLRQKAGYMNDLVEALFELTKVSSGVLESKKEQIDLVRLLEQTIGLFDDQLVSAGLTVKRSYCADTIPVITDGARMHQVFANLLGNAIKYALAGTRIYLEVRETENSYLARMVNTASYEMDFKPDEIMQRFARGDKARSTQGSGLGLAIARTYTESVGGSFRIFVDGDQFSAIVELPKNERNL